VEGEVLHRKLVPFAARQSERYEQAFCQGMPVWERVEDASHWSGYVLLAEWQLRDAGLQRLVEVHAWRCGWNRPHAYRIAWRWGDSL
jgi:hypothetical protein